MCVKWPSMQVIYLNLNTAKYGMIWASKCSAHVDIAFLGECSVSGSLLDR